MTRLPSSVRNKFEKTRQRQLLIEAKRSITDMIDALNAPAHMATFRNAGIAESLVRRTRLASQAFEEKIT